MMSHFHKNTLAMRRESNLDTSFKKWHKKIHKNESQLEMCFFFQTF